jgi:uncharacterized protein (DUF885 family)
LYFVPIFANRLTIDFIALALHETNPGHHLQVCTG